MRLHPEGRGAVPSAWAWNRTRLAGARGLAAALALAACASAPPPAPAPVPEPPPPPPPPPPPALCLLDRGPSAGPPGPATWPSLLVRGIDPATGFATWPALDCTGAQVRWDAPVAACDDPGPVGTPLPDRRLGPEDVVTAQVSPELTAVWVVVHRFAGGDALGPVALVRQAGSSLRVESIGPLRAYPLRARLRLERIGDTRVLVAEGEHCPPAGEGCLRAARIVPLVRERFTPAPLRSEDGRCLAAASFDLARSERRPAGRGWERVDLTASLEFGPSALSVNETVAVQDLGPSAGGEPRRVLHRAQATRTVRWAGGQLVSKGEPLWSLMRAARGP